MKKILPKTIVVTGASKGIGLRLCEKLKAQGHNVVALARSIEDKPPFFFRCDVSDFNRLQEVFGIVAGHFGVIDIVINNAGFGQSGALELIDADSIDKIVDVNLKGPVYACKCALGYMKPGSRIINISSAAAFVPMPFRTMYSVTKSAVNMLSKGLSMELDGTGIEVSALCLGDIKTDFFLHRDAVTLTSDRYGDRIKNVDDFVTSRQSAGKKADLDRTVDKIIKKTFCKKPKDMNIIGGKWKIIYIAVKFLPASVSAGIVKRIFGD